MSRARRSVDDLTPLEWSWTARAGDGREMETLMIFAPFKM
jgi:hypothetical protein